jgi:nickel-dependent lactate racemase
LPRLGDLVEAGMDVALVIDDLSRPTPVARILPAVLEALERSGARRETITLVTALGVHRPMDEDEIAERIGGTELLASLRWENHDCDAAEHLVQLGTTARGTPVLVNRTVAQADLIVSIGCIEPHIIASFGGGYKNLIPGVAGRSTIAHNHTLNCTPSTFNMVGQPIERNPMRLDLEEAGRMLEPPVFIVNAVLNSRQEVIQIVAGDPIAAHREGVRSSGALYGAELPTLTDVVITSSHPMDTDLRQGVKALANTVRAVRPGGVHITLVRAEEGVGVFGLADRKLPLGRRALKLLAPLLLRLVPRLSIQGMGEEDRFFLYFALQAMRRADLMLYAPTIPADVRANLPFVTFVDSVEEALARAQRRCPGQADALAFPHGGITYPILPGS